MSVTKYLSKEWGRGNEIALFLLRVVAGLVLLYGHGFKKLTTIFSGEEIRFMDPLGIGATSSYYMAGFAEGICAILLILGLFSRLATLVLAINFVVIFYVHAIGGDGFQELELIFFYLASFVALTFSGPGRFSLDYWWFGKRNNRR